MSSPFRDVPSAAATVYEWEIFWAGMLSRGFGTAFHDVFTFAVDGEFTRTLVASGARRVLCLGNGVSFEPHGLAAAGLDVDALDLSPYATLIARLAEPHPKLPHAFCPADCIRPGGRATFIAGNALDPAIWPGPYDAIIERKFLQLVPSDDRTRALDVVRGRLGPTGFLLSHAHNGGWHYSEPRLHPLADDFRASGWNVRDEGPLFPADGKSVRLMLTTG